MRVDAWLDVACLFKTRSEAKRGWEGGKVEVNGDPAKPHRVLREGDRVRINRGYGRYQDVIVRILIDQHVKKAEARALYDDVTPKPSPEEVEIRAVAVHAVERIADTLRASGIETSPRRLDYLLWNRGGGEIYKRLPRHRTRTVYY